MNPADLLVGAVVLVLIGGVVCYLWKNRGSGCSCGGGSSCAGCSGNCSRCSKKK